MVENMSELKPESLLNLDDLLQCPVCYEIPTGQIFQCNEGHHVCGRCKTRLDVCPVCRALFFGTRNYAMEELISNFRKLRTLKSSDKLTPGSSESSTPAKDKTSEEPENDNNDEEEENNDTNIINPPPVRAPQSCKGLFRCLCCKNGTKERLPAARLLNHLRYFHGPDLLQGRSENGEYLQAWQFSTSPGRLATALRIADMGLFFLIIEIGGDSVCAWLAMAASPWVANAFMYTVTICGNDREAIFSDCVWSVRSCEGALKKRGHCLYVKDIDGQALIAPTTISGKLSVRRIPADQHANQTQPRAVLRIANRVHTHNTHNLEPFLQDLQNDVARLSRAFATLGREANALVRSEAEIRARIENTPNIDEMAADQRDESVDNDSAGLQLSRHARRRMRQRVRAALNGPVEPPVPAPRVVEPVVNRRQNCILHNSDSPQYIRGSIGPSAAPSASLAPVPPPSTSRGPSDGQNERSQNRDNTRNKKKHRQRR